MVLSEIFFISIRVAMCLNKFIFDSPKAHDALLFMTILSTDLKALKRRGYNGSSNVFAVSNL